MKFMLVTMMLANPMTYADKATCEIAADALKSVDVEAVCIPAGNQEKSAADELFAHMQQMIQRLEKMKIDLENTK
jgi:hypothetical protein